MSSKDNMIITYPVGKRRNFSTIYECNFCENFTADSVADLTFHTEKYHIKVNSQICIKKECVFPNCNFTGSVKHLRIHYTEHSKDELMSDKTCLICKEQRDSTSKLQRHIGLMHMLQYEYVCSICTGWNHFASFIIKDWVDHAYDIHVENPPVLRINEDEGYSPKSRCVENKKMAEKVENMPYIQPKWKYVCILCSITGSNLCSMAKHVEDHFVKGNGEHPCPHCPHHSRSPYELLKHGSIKHQKKFSILKFICAECNGVLEYEKLGSDYILKHQRKIDGSVYDCTINVGKVKSKIVEALVSLEWLKRTTE